MLVYKKFNSTIEVKRQSIKINYSYDILLMDGYTIQKAVTCDINSAKCEGGQ